MVGMSIAVPATYFLVLSIVSGLIGGFLELFEIKLSSLTIERRKELSAHLLASLAFFISLISLLMAIGFIVPVK